MGRIRFGVPQETVSITCPACGFVYTIFDRPQVEQVANTLQAQEWRQVNELWYSPQCQPGSGSGKTVLLAPGQKIGEPQKTITFTCPATTTQKTIFTARIQTAVKVIQREHQWRQIGGRWLSPKGYQRAAGTPITKTRKIK